VVNSMVAEFPLSGDAVDFSDSETDGGDEGAVEMCPRDSPPTWYVGFSNCEMDGGDD
jgi:hypothetical protein